MTDEGRLMKQFQFTPPIELPQALTTLEIEYLDVSPTRVLVIYTRWVLNIVVTDGQLSDARTVEIEVIDHPPAASEDPLTLIEDVVNRLRTTMEATGQGSTHRSGTNVS